jgi:hypothetical protein
MLIIGFGGPAEHGKSTCAKMAEDWFTSKGLNVKVISFADRLKTVCKIMFRMTDRDVNNTIGKVTFKSHLGTTPREILQKFGTEVCRESISKYLPVFTDQCGSTIWTWNVRKDIEELYEDDSTDVILIPDVRFNDELDMLRSSKDETRFKDFIFINVKRDCTDSANEKHESEKGLADPEYVIENNGTLKDLSEKINSLLKYLASSNSNSSSSDESEW